MFGRVDFFCFSHPPKHIPIAEPKIVVGSGTGSAKIVVDIDTSSGTSAVVIFRWARRSRLRKPFSLSLKKRMPNPAKELLLLIL